ncbi:MAG: hypothetical protein IH792_01970 [Thaumarchaeota archaeon]|nr:hypothetical protein [Nitrososphaerota archaeon]
MGLSVAISGGIVLTVIMLILLSMPGIVEKMFSIGDVTSQVAQFEKTISDTKISMEDLDVSVNSPKINFTVINEGLEKLWNFNDFNLFVTYDEATGRPTETLSFDGMCQGVVPSAGNWCIETISEDILDPDVINGGESARIWTRVNQDLTTGNTIVSFNTDNGATATLPVTSRSIIATGVDPPVACESGFYGRTFIDTDTGISYVCDPTRDKWLSFETMVLFGDESGTCDGDGTNDPNNDEGCNVDWGNGLGASVGGGNAELGLYVPYDSTIISVGWAVDDIECDGGGSFDLEFWSTGSNLVDEPYTLDQEIVTGLSSTQVYNDNNLNIDINGDQYTLWGIDNNCTGGNNDMDDWNMIIYLKWHHADP